MTVTAGSNLSKIKAAAGVTGTKKAASEDGLKFSIGKSGQITEAEIAAIQGIGRKSINAFTSADIQKTEPFAQRYWQEMGVKSPFFRAWFGDWRANDQTPVPIAKIPLYIDSNEARKKNRGAVKNEDTSWIISISREGETNTISHAGKERLSEYGLSGIQELISNAYLLDTEVHEHHSNNAKNDLIAFDHKLYALGENEKGEVALYRITAEDYFQSKKQPSNKRFHNLKHIEKIADITGGRTFGKNRSGGSTNGISAITYTVADLVNFVNMYDSEYTSPAKSSVVTKEGLPLVVYHGTNAENGDFYVFDESEAKKKGGLGFKALGKGNYFTATKLDGTERYGARVIAAYLDVKTPFVFDGGMSFREQVSKELGIDAESMSYNEIQKVMRDAGYDGVIQYDKNGDIQLAVTFDSKQIKSATDNIGTFDKANPDIRYSVPKIDQAYMKAVNNGDNGEVIHQPGRFNPWNDDIRYNLPVEQASPTYEELVAKGSIAVVNIGRNDEGLSYADLRDRVIKNANERKAFDVPHPNRDTNVLIFLTEKSFTHAFGELNSTFGEDTILAMDHITEIIREAVLSHIALPKNPLKAEARVFTFFAAIKGKNGVEPIKLTVKEYIRRDFELFPKNIENYFKQNEGTDTHNRLYDAEALEVVSVESVKEEPGASASDQTRKIRNLTKGTPDSSIKIADLLGLVNGDAKKYIPIPGTTEDTPHKLPVGEDTSPGALLANALESVATTDAEREKLRQYKANIETLNGLEARLRELRAEIKKLSFAKGKRDTVRIAELRDEATKTANRIKIMDGMQTQKKL